MIKTLILISLIITSPLFAESLPIISKDRKTSVITNNANDDIKFIEKELNYGLEKGFYNTADDKRRIDIAYFMNSSIEPNNLTDIFSISTFHLGISFKKTITWYEFIYEMTSADTDAILFNQETGIKEKIHSVGIGASYRFRMFESLIKSDQIFQTVHSYLTYNILTHSLDGNAYNGIGIKADFGIHKRVSRNFHYGIKFSYNIVPVSFGKKALNSHWASIGLDLAVYTF